MSERRAMKCNVCGAVGRYGPSCSVCFVAQRCVCTGHGHRPDVFDADVCTVEPCGCERRS